MEIDQEPQRYNSEILTPDQASMLKSALFLFKKNPKRYALDYRQTAECEVIERRLVDRFTGEELLPWTITEYFGQLTYIPDQEVKCGTVLQMLQLR
jgi:hypothetical protein